MIITVATIIGVAGVIGSLLFSGWQARQLVRQQRLQNALAGASGSYQPMQLLHGVLRNVYEEPWLRAHLYDGKDLPPAGDARSRVLTTAEMLGDVLEVGLHTAKTVHATQMYEDWHDYAGHILAHSPALAGLVRDHPRWYPALVPILEQSQLRRQPAVHGVDVA